MSSRNAASAIADEIERLDWKNCTIDHLVAIGKAVDALRATQPAAGEPVYQLRNANIGPEWHQVDRVAYDEFASMPAYERRTLWTAPPAAAHGDEALLWELLEELRTATDRQALPGAFIRVMWEAGCEWINARPTMRAQNDGDEAVPADLKARCQEIAQWRKSGVLQGDALRKYAESRWPRDPSALQMAEHETATDAFRIVAAMRAQGDGEVQ